MNVVNWSSFELIQLLKEISLHNGSIKLDLQVTVVVIIKICCL